MEVISPLTESAWLGWSKKMLNFNNETIIVILVAGNKLAFERPCLIPTRCCFHMWVRTSVVCELVQISTTVLYALNVTDCPIEENLSDRFKGIHFLDLSLCALLKARLNSLEYIFMKTPLCTIHFAGIQSRIN